MILTNFVSFSQLEQEGSVLICRKQMSSSYSILIGILKSIFKRSTELIELVKNNK